MQDFEASLLASVFTKAVVCATGWRVVNDVYLTCFDSVAGSRGPEKVPDLRGNVLSERFRAGYL